MELSLLLVELNQIEEDQFAEPDSDMQTTDEDVGEMNDYHKRLYTLARKMGRVAAEALVEGKFNNDATKKQDSMKRAEEYKTKSTIVMDVMWASINDDFSLWDKETVGVRRGFRVVINKSKRPRGLLEILSGFDQ
jgi:hypothetical protein